MKYVKLYVRCVTRHKKYSIVTTFEKKKRERQCFQIDLSANAKYWSASTYKTITYYYLIKIIISLFILFKLKK